MTINVESPNSHGDEPLAHMPAETTATLDDAQKKAISHAADEVAKRTWALGHAVDIRISFPLARYFVTIVAATSGGAATRCGESEIFCLSPSRQPSFMPPPLWGFSFIAQF